MSTPINLNELVATFASYSISDLHRESGVAPSTIWRWAKGIHQPNTRTLKRLEEAAERLEKRGIDG